MSAPTRREFLRVAASVPAGVSLFDVASLRAAPVAGYPRGRWEKLPCPPGRVDYIRDIALDERDVLWVMSSSSVTYWDGRKYGVPQGMEGESGEMLLKFHGGPDRGVFHAKVFTKRIGDGNARYGEVYRLRDGRVSRVAQFRYDVSRSNPGFHVSAAGRLFHWGQGYLAFHTGDGWERIAADVAPGHVRAVEVGDRVHFLTSNNNLVTIREPGARVTQSTLGPGAPLWAQSQTIASIRSGKHRWTRDLEEAAGFDMSLVSARARSYPGTRSFRVSDGAVWLTVSMDPPGVVFLRVELDGVVSRVEHTADLLHAFPYDVRATSVLPTSDGCLWAGLSAGGAIRLKADDRYLFDGRTGLTVPGPRLEDSRGKLYSGLYVFQPHRPDEKSRSSVVRRPMLPEILWKWAPERSPEIQHAWQIGSWVVVFHRAAFTMSRHTLAVLDPTTGRKLVERDVDTHGSRQVWAVPGDRPDEMLFVYPNHVLAIELPTVTIRERTEYPINFRIPPIAIGDRYLVANRSNLALIDRGGSEVWTHPWRGGSADTIPLAVFGPLAVAQTRSKTTVGIDLHTGKQLWLDRTGGRGSGAAFGDDARYVVEADTWLSPQVAESGILARESRSGRRLWQCRKPGMISHVPVVDRKRDRVLAIFDRGNVVCLAGEDGSEVWETGLPENPHRAAGQAHNRPYWPAVSLQDDRLWVVDRNRVLHLLDLDAGRFDASIAVTTALSDDGTLPIPTNLVAMPWRADKALVVATELGTAGYRVSDALPAERIP